MYEVLGGLEVRERPTSRWLDGSNLSLLFSLGRESLLVILNELLNVHLVLILKVLERGEVDSTEVILSSLALAAMLTVGAAGLLQDILSANLVPVLRLDERVSLALLLLIHGSLLPQNFSGLPVVLHLCRIEELLFLELLLLATLL